MSNITSISEGLHPEDEIIVSDRTSPEFLQTVQAVSDYLKALPLSVEQNDTLVALLVSHVQAAERESFKTGIDLGIKIAKSEAML